jgi:hypothetical protein
MGGGLTFMVGMGFNALLDTRMCKSIPSKVDQSGEPGVKRNDMVWYIKLSISKEVSMPKVWASITRHGPSKKRHT